MEMQDVDYELIYEPDKDAADPMDYLSRHPLPDTERDNTERAIKLVVRNERGVVMKSVREATKADEVLRQVL